MFCYFLKPGVITLEVYDIGLISNLFIGILLIC